MAERIRTARLYQDDFDYKPTFKIWLSTNHVPVIRGTDEGIWRRVNRIDFNVVIPEEKRDRHLGAKLEAEASGILNWALEGLKEYQAHGLKVPKAVIQATTQYREEQNLVARFLEECTEKAAVFESVEAATLFRSFKDWAEAGSEFEAQPDEIWGRSQETADLQENERWSGLRGHKDGNRRCYTGFDGGC